MAEQVTLHDRGGGIGTKIRIAGDGDGWEGKLVDLATESHRGVGRAASGNVAQPNARIRMQGTELLQSSIEGFLLRSCFYVRQMRIGKKCNFHR